jgi:hypothetical protein
VRGDWYRTLTSDNNYAISFRNLRTNQIQLRDERLQWVLYENGPYRVAQQIVWHRNGAVPGYRSAYRWLKHYPGYQGGTDFCLIQ